MGLRELQSKDILNRAVGNAFLALMMRIIERFVVFYNVLRLQVGEHLNAGRVYENYTVDRTKTQKLFLPRCCLCNVDLTQE